ncbi:MAG: winged helix-turn-helix domain-containing protein [Nitrososphaerota archaeon]
MGRRAKSELIILSELLGSPLSFSELVTRTKIPKPTVSHALKRLAKKQLVDAFLIEGKIKWRLTIRGFFLALDFKKYEAFGGAVSAKEIIDLMKCLRVWNEKNWETIFKMAENALNKKISDRVRIKIDIMKDMLNMVWDIFEGEYAMLFSTSLTIAIMMLDELESEEDVKKYKEEKLPILYDVIMKSVKKNFDKIFSSFVENKFQNHNPKI